MDLLKIERTDKVILILPFILGMILFYLEDIISNKFIQTFDLNVKIEKPIILENLLKVQKIKSLVDENVNSFAISNLLIDDSLIKTQDKQIQNLPQLSEILKNEPNLPEITKKPLKLQGIFITDKFKFAILDGKIVKEGHTLDDIKVVKIENTKVLIKEKSGGNIWLKLD